MENTQRQQLAGDALVTTAVLALGAVLVVAGGTLAGNIAPNRLGDWLRIVPAALDGASEPRVDVLLGLLASIIGLSVVAWWVFSATLAIASALLAAAGSHRASQRTGALAPLFMRRLAMAALGLSLVAAPAAHADGLPDPAWHAAPSEQSASASLVPAGPSSAGPLAAGETAPAGGTAAAGGTVGAAALPAAPPSASPSSPLPSAQPSSAAATPTPSAAPTPSQAAWIPPAVPADPGLLVQQPKRETAGSAREPVEVRPGDSLWSIVARHLGPGATDLEVAAVWPDWYDANEGVIGDSPHLIRPGQLLVPPR
ncbi:LysM domain-containing protein [Sinomonas sp. ASV486]|uniref:LysM peptidoglycan-binding domain-containing protein n=1 Tax=Sinomonas sp. ASV486 TaxID=3051170 RepID=UPI0027DDB32B|nr:LysM domain-containing protein [Sinomonas sp. ASV486]MDQ4490998.1 LysM domain-containing protein [Sinomonas sp. ASV486]